MRNILFALLAALFILTGYVSYVGEISNSFSFFISGIIGLLSILGSLIFGRKQAVLESANSINSIFRGALSIGLQSVKSLSRTRKRHSMMANKASSSYFFVGIAGGKILREIFEIDFFKNNRNKESIKIILMDPFSVKSSKIITGEEDKSNAIEEIISSIIFLNDMLSNGRVFELRLFPRVPPARIILADNKYVSISSYKKGSDGWVNPEMYFEVDGDEISPVIDFNELFASLWERANGISMHHRAHSLLAISRNKNKEIARRGIKQFDKVMVHGRFQPFHNEHLEFILLGLLHSKEKLIIGVTNPQNEYKKKSLENGAAHRYNEEGNPYSFELRKEMISRTLDTFNVEQSRYEVIPFDIDSGEFELKRIAIEYGESLVHALKIFSNWEREKIEKIRTSGMNVFILKDGDAEVTKKHVSGTLVRELLSSERNWEDFIPLGTKSVLTDIYLEARQGAKK